MKTELQATIVALALLTSFPANALITITRQPTNQWVSLGAHVTNEVRVTSTAPPITFEWRGPSGPLLSGETNVSSARLTLVLPNIQTNQAGGYYVILTDADNVPVQSDTATITVDPTFIKITEGPLVTDVEETETSLWWDYDNDGDLDVLVQVGAPSGTGGLQSFYRNDGDDVFTKVTTNAVAASRKRAQGAVAGDIDNDGDLDLYAGSNAWRSNDPKDDLFLNHGNGLFTVVTGGSWSQDLDHSFDCTFVDINRDGLLDIFVHNYDQPGQVYRQTVAGAFIKVTASEVGSLLGNPGPSYNATWVDYDSDGDLDLWTENARGGSRLHQNDGHGSFTLATPASFAQAPGGVGVWADFDNDGFPELFVGGATEGGDRPNALFRGVAAQDFANVAVAAGVAQSVSAWVPSVGDYDNDGWLDIFACYWYQGAANAARTNVMFHNRGDGTFETVEVGSPIRDGQDLRSGSRWVDYDNDGFLDLFLTCGTADATTRYPRLNHLFRNNGPAIGNTNHWLKIKLNGQAANRSGIGAKIRVKATIGGRGFWQVRELTGNGWSETCPGLIAHFGLGDATKADLVRVEWPSGNVQELTDVPAGQAGQAALTITEQVFITPVRPSSSLGGSVTLTSSRSGATAWQWYHDAAAMDGQTGRTLALSNITTNDAGRYSVVVTTATGTFTNHVYLLVDTQFERIPMGSTSPSWGCAWGDYNNDDYPDLFVAEGTVVSVAPSSLYRNLKDGSLVKVTAEEAGNIVGLARHWWCPAWGDYNNDGDLDLFVTDGNETSAPQAVLWRNLGDGRFVEATEAGSFASDSLFTVPMWGDFDRDGHLDLFVANAWYEPPTWDVHNVLYRSLGNGTFRKEADDEIVRFRGQLQGGSAGDMDGDGDLDILLTGREGATLFENGGAGGFHRIGFPTVSGFCITPSWADYDNDGRLDVFVAVYSGGATSRLLHNDGDGAWTTIALGPALETSAGMWADYDNDGDLDLFITRGQSTTTTNLLYSNNGDGTFAQVSLGSLANDRGRWAGCAWADYDNNGFQDLFVTGHASTPEVLYRNYGNSNHWISFKVVGTASNRSAIGAKVRVRATIFGKTYWQMREIGGGNRHQNDLRPHFGLGDATGAKTVRVEWPSGAIEEFSNLARDQFYTIVEPSLRGSMKSNGEFELTATASTNRVCTLDVSSDLSNWTTLTNFTGAGETPVRVSDLEAPGQSQRFYQLK